MYNYYPPKLPKWALNPEQALRKLWSIDSGICTCGQAIQICNNIAASSKLPASLRQKATERRNKLILGNGRGGNTRGKKKPTDVIQLAAHRK